VADSALVVARLLLLDMLRPQRQAPMYPEILHISFLHTYGALVAWPSWPASYSYTPAKPAGLTRAVVNLGIYCALSAIAGAKLMMFLVDIPYYSKYPSEIFTLPPCKPAASSTAASSPRCRLLVVHAQDAPAASRLPTSSHPG